MCPITEGRARRWRGVAREADRLRRQLSPDTVPDDRLALRLALDPPTTDRELRALAAQSSHNADLIALIGIETYTAW